MTTIDEIWTHIDAEQPFTVHLSDGRKFFIKDHHWISSHPGRKGTSIRIYGPNEEEEHFIPLFAVTRISRNGLI